MTVQGKKIEFLSSKRSESTWQWRPAGNDPPCRGTSRQQSKSTHRPKARSHAPVAA